MSFIELGNGQVIGSKLIDIEATGKEEGKGFALISTANADLDKDIIHQTKNEKGNGWVLGKFNKHGRILWGHDHSIPAIGKGKAYIDLHDGEKALYMDYEFDMEDEFAAGIAGKYERSVLDQWSVGFMMEDGAWGWRDEENKWSGGIEIYESILHECSAVNVPANAETDTFAKSFLKANPHLIKDEHLEDNEVAGLKAELGFYRDEIESRLKALETAASYTEEKSTEVLEAVKEMQSIDSKVAGRLVKTLQQLTFNK